MKNNQLKNVLDLFDTGDEEDAVLESAKSAMFERQIVDRLISLRLLRQASQGDVAKHMGVTQSRVSKIENGDDRSLSIGQIDSYLEALGMRFEMRFCQSGDTIVERLKSHAFELYGCLQKISEMSNGDPEMEKAALRMHAETIVNVDRFVSSSAATLPLVQESIQTLKATSTRKAKKEPVRLSHDAVQEPAVV